MVQHLKQDKSPALYHASLFDWKKISSLFISGKKYCTDQILPTLP